jgi:hypothetical protein
MPEYRVKISGNSDHNALYNLSSNPTDKVTEFDSNFIWPALVLCTIGLFDTILWAEIKLKNYVEGIVLIYVLIFVNKGYRNKNFLCLSFGNRKSNLIKKIHILE